MSHVEDLHEPNDRKPDEPEQEVRIDLDAVEESIRVYYSGSDDESGKAAEDLLTVAAPLVTELREARERIAAFEALPTREQWAVTDGPEIPPAEGDYLPDGGHAERALKYARQENGQAWRQRLTVHPPEPISPDAPF